MTCTTVAKYDPIELSFSSHWEKPDDHSILSDDTIRHFIKNKTPSDLLALQSEFTHSQKSSDQLSTTACMEWLSALLEDSLSINGEAFPFRKTVDCSKEDLEKYLDNKTRLELAWVEPSDTMFKGILDLIADRKITHFKIQGGFSLSESQFRQLIESLSKAPPLISLELSNIQLSTDQMIEISHIVQKLPNLNKLTLESNGIKNTAIPHFVQMIHDNPNLIEIKLTLSLFKSLDNFSALANAGNESQKIDLSSNWDAI